MWFDNDYTLPKDTKMNLKIYSQSQLNINLQIGLCFAMFVIVLSITYTECPIYLLVFWLHFILIMKLVNTR